MKRAILFLIVGIALGGGGVWLKYHGGGTGSAAAPEKPADEPEAKTTVSHDTNGNVIVHMDDEAQGDAGILVANPAAAKFNQELKGYGRVTDPAPLSALATELAAAQAGYGASSNELARLKILEGQGNASTRALQSAEAAAQRDRLAVGSARDRLILAWGQPVADLPDLPAFAQSLTAQSAALVRVDLPAGETPPAQPTGARLAALSGESADAEFFGLAAAVDPQTQSRGYLFLLKPNAIKLAPGEAVTGFLKLPGDALSGVIVPRDSIVRTEGAGWVYVLNADSESFTRTKVDLDHPADNGWFVSKNVAAGDHVVVTGAQLLLSEELKATIKAD
jgi:hypothetical protein